jgi:hypothetical protein
VIRRSSSRCCPIEARSRCNAEPRRRRCRCRRGCPGGTGKTAACRDQSASLSAFCWKT